MTRRCNERIQADFPGTHGPGLQIAVSICDLQTAESTVLARRVVLPGFIEPN